MSQLTIGSSTYSKIPFIGPSAAAFIAAFTSSTVTFFSNSTVKSTTEPSGVGTLIDNPCNLPANSGITKPTAFAAPVEVGMIEQAAALALLKSL